MGIRPDRLSSRSRETKGYQHTTSKGFCCGVDTARDSPGAHLVDVTYHYYGHVSAHVVSIRSIPSG